MDFVIFWSQTLQRVLNLARGRGLPLGLEGPGDAGPSCASLA